MTISYYDKTDWIISKVFRRTLFVMVIAELSTSLATMVDGIIIARCLDEYAVAAHGLIAPYTNVVKLLGCFFATGTQVVCSGKMAKAKLEDANKCFSASTIALIIVSFSIGSLVAVFSTPIAKLLGAGSDAENLLRVTSDYLKGLAIGLPVTLGTLFLIPFMNLDGDKKRITVAINVMMWTNVMGDILNAFLLNGGMLGMALATSFSYLCSFFVLMLHFGKKSSFHFSFKGLRWNSFIPVAKAGTIPSFTRLFSTFRSYSLNMIFVTYVSTAALAANSLVQNNIKVVLICMATAIGSITLTMTGFLFGEEDKRGICQMFSTVLKICFGPCIIVSAIVFIFAPAIASLFGAGEYISLTTEALRVYIVGFPFIGVKMFYIYYFQGSMSKKLSYYSSVAGEFLFLVLLAFVLVRYFGTFGLWMAYPMSEILYVASIFILAWIKCGHFPHAIEDLLFFNKEFDVDGENKIDVTVSGIDDVVGMSKKAQSFCREHGIEDYRGFILALTVEEMAGNIFEHGANDGKEHFVDLKIVLKEDKIILRLRDDCRPFNPKERADMLSENLIENIGIRIIMKISKKVSYANVLNLNQLIIEL